MTKEYVTLSPSINSGQALYLLLKKPNNNRHSVSGVSQERFESAGRQIRLPADSRTISNPSQAGSDRPARFGEYSPHLRRTEATCSDRILNFSNRTCTEWHITRISTRPMLTTGSSSSLDGREPESPGYSALRSPRNVSGPATPRPARAALKATR